MSQSYNIEITCISDALNKITYVETIDINEC